MASENDNNYQARLIIGCLSLKTKCLISGQLRKSQVKELGKSLDLTHTETDYFLQCQNPVHEMLDRVRHKKDIEDLIYTLKELNLPDDNIANSRIEHDCREFHRQTKPETGLRKDDGSVVQMQEVNYLHQPRPKVQFTLQEVNKLNLSGEFDAYISCSMKNKDQVMSILCQLENRQNQLKVCLPQRDLLATLSIPLVTPELITKRCKYTMMFLSPEFFQSKECLFQSEIVTWFSAGAAKKKYILIKLKDYEETLSSEHDVFTALFSYVSSIDLTRNKDWEFGRLITALKD